MGLVHLLFNRPEINLIVLFLCFPSIYLKSYIFIGCYIWTTGPCFQFDCVLYTREFCEYFELHRDTCYIIFMAAGWVASSRTLIKSQMKQALAIPCVDPIIAVDASKLNARSQGPNYSCCLQNRQQNSPCLFRKNTAPKKPSHCSMAPLIQQVLKQNTTLKEEGD